jgi:flagellar biosynthetic protein FliQ
VGPGDAMDIAREAIMVALKLGAPVMLLALVIGLAVSLFQALTQIQEMTLTFVPKIIAIMLSLLLLLPFMLATLSNFMDRLVDRIISG